MTSKRSRRIKEKCPGDFFWEGEGGRQDLDM
jgi:hypothetical protein